MVLSFISTFYHVYLLSSLFQPTTTLDISLFFIQQVQQKISFIILETRHTTKNKNGPRIIFQTLFHIITLLLRIFILLCILLVISILELVQLYHQTITTTHHYHHHKLPIANTIKNDDHIIKQKEQSLSLLPTPPSEKCDLMTTLPTNNVLPIIIKEDRSQGDTAVKPAPSEPTPPDHDKLDSKQQQQTMPMDNNNNNNNNNNNIIISTNAKPADDEVDMHHPIIEKQQSPLLASQPDHLPNDLLATSITDINNQDAGHDNNDTPIVDPPSTAIADIITTSPNEHMIINDDENPVVEPVISEMPDHAPTLSPHESDNDDDDDKTQNDDNNGNDQLQQHPEAPCLPPPPPPPPLSPSGSLSSSLSTLAHTHSNHQQQHQQQQKQQQQHQQENQPPPTKEPTHHHSTSQLHHAYIENQQQQQLKHNSPPLRPHSSYSARTHRSEIKTTSPPSMPSPPVAPAPQGSSLSMKLNKLKKPGRRLSQLFKKKKDNKNKADQS